MRGEMTHASGAAPRALAGGIVSHSPALPTAEPFIGGTGAMEDSRLRAPVCDVATPSPHSPIPSSLYCLAGATATGKSAVIQYLAERYGATILSADAMLVYRGMDIGTAKPTSEERVRVPYLGLDCVSPAEDFSAAAWLREVEEWKDGRSVPPAGCSPAPLPLPLQRRSTCPPIPPSPHLSVPLFATGGTGLYFSALLRGLEPTPPSDSDVRARLEALGTEELRRRLQERGATLPEADWANPRRLVRALEILELGGELPKGWSAREKPVLPALTWDRAALHARIARRVDAMYRDGLLDETAALRKRFPMWSRTATQAIGYAEAMAVLEGILTVAEAKERTVIRTRQLARRQETYLRHQFDIRWIHVSDTDDLPSLADRVEAIWGLHA